MKNTQQPSGALAENECVNKDEKGGGDLVLREKEKEAV